MSALAHCCREYDGAIALTWTDFENTRARRNVPRPDYADTMFELRTVVGTGAVNFEKFVNVKGVGCHVWSIKGIRTFLESEVVCKAILSILYLGGPLGLRCGQLVHAG